MLSIPLFRCNQRKFPDRSKNQNNSVILSPELSWLKVWIEKSSLTNSLELL